MKYWLLIWFMSGHDGSVVNYKERMYVTKQQCVAAAGREQIKQVNTTTAVLTFCVTDDHHSGRKQDPGVPFDF